MRRNALLYAWLPLASALSLANFQEITSTSIPLACQLTYDQQIPNCVMADFSDAGCSKTCQQSLTTLASSVTKACSNIKVNANTLLGIIKNGEILIAICPAVQKTTTIAAKTTAAPPAAVNTSPSVATIVTLPTGSPGVIVDSKTSTSHASATVAPVVTSSKAATKSKSSSVIVVNSATHSEAATTPTTSSANGGIGDGAAATSLSAKESKTTVSSTSSAGSAATQKSNSQSQQSNTGGGSPFDISSNGDGARLGSRSMVVFAVAACVGLVLAR